jgi:hypothetical protein
MFTSARFIKKLVLTRVAGLWLGPSRWILSDGGLATDHSSAGGWSRAREPTTTACTARCISAATSV